MADRTPRTKPAKLPSWNSRTQLMFHRFLESAPDAMLITNEQGKILIANTNTERLFGYSHHELVGQSVEQLMPERHCSAA